MSPAGGNRGFHAALIRGFCAMAEFRDPDTGAHLDRLATYARVLATQLRDESPYSELCGATFTRQLRAAVPLHDIGKVAIPDRILLKPGPLTPPERGVMQTHTVVGHQLLQSVRRLAPSTRAGDLDMAAEIALNHHERWDGKGYPRGLQGEAIPLVARITAVVDVYDACSTSRCYRREGMSPAALRDLILGGAGTQFDPVVVAAFQAVEPRFRRLREAMADPPLPGAGEAALGMAVDGRQSVLIVDDEPGVRRTLRHVLEQIGCRCEEADRVTTARQRLQEQHFDLVTVDIRLPGEFGTALLTELAPRAPEVAVIIVTGEGDVETGVQAMRDGAYDYLVKPFHLAHVRIAVERALERQRLEQEALAYRVRLEHMVAARARELVAALARERR